MPLLPPVVAFPHWSWLLSHIGAADRIYGSGNFSQILAFRIDEVNAILPLHVFIFPRTVGLFVLGMLTWRMGIVQNAARHARPLQLTALLGIAIGLGLIVANKGSETMARAGTIVLALGYAGLVIGRRRARRADGSPGRSRSGAWPSRTISPSR
jgi:uncharacterized protein